MTERLLDRHGGRGRVAADFAGREEIAGPRSELDGALLMGAAWVINLGVVGRAGRLRRAPLARAAIVVVSHPH